MPYSATTKPKNRSKSPCRYTKGLKHPLVDPGMLVYIHAWFCFQVLHARCSSNRDTAGSNSEMTLAHLTNSLLLSGLCQKRECGELAGEFGRVQFASSQKAATTTPPPQGLGENGKRQVRGVHEPSLQRPKETCQFTCFHLWGSPNSADCPL